MKGFWWLASLALLIGCGRGEGGTPVGEDEAATFQNVRAGVAYVGDEACASCHAELVASYSTHGMAQSYYPLTAENAVEDFSGVTVFDAQHQLYYRPYREGGRFFQEEYRQGTGGEKTHRLVREMQYVVGSGSAARTYLVENNGRLYQLPLTWYTQERKWDFSPGYAVDNARFDRLVPDRCMACHNSYPESVPFASGKYTRVPHGIGCERCHGPGALHVEARLSDPEAPEGIDRTIVNPKHLSLERRLDVCGQCHLQATVSLLREGETAFSFRPGQRLDAHVALFSVDAPPAEDRISVISHADRMMKSACFIESRTMDCVTCHNPHEGFRDKGPAYFNATCQGCHAPAALQARFTSAETKVQHAPTSDCTSCHMPKVASSEAPHSSFTDHWIRVVRTSVTPPAEAAADAQLVAYFETDRERAEGKIYEGMAYVVYGRQRGDRSAMEKGARTLGEALAGREGYGEAHFLLGFAKLQLGQAAEAVPALEKAVALGAVPERLNALAQAYESTRRDPASISRLYEQALQIQPALAEVRLNYGRFLEAQGRIPEAAQQYRLAAQEQPWLPAAQYNLGTAYLRQSNLSEGEQALARAIALDPNHAQARGNLGLLYASRGEKLKARAQFEAAAEAAPESAVALGNLGAFYLNEGDPARAQPLLERSVRLNPGYVDGLVNLAVLHVQQGDAASAQRHALQALQLDPANARARAVMGALQR